MYIYEKAFQDLEFGLKDSCLGNSGANGKVTKIFWNRIINSRRRWVSMNQLSPGFPNYSICIETSPIVNLLFFLGSRSWIRQILRTWLPRRSGLFGGGQNMVNPNH